MAKNYIQPGNVITVTAPADVKSGDPILVGVIFGVCAFDALAGADVELLVTGVHDLPSAGVIAAYAAVYWDAAAKKITATAAAHVLVGYALLAVGAAGTVARVRLIGGPAMV